MKQLIQRMKTDLTTVRKALRLARNEAVWTEEQYAEFEEALEAGNNLARRLERLRTRVFEPKATVPLPFTPGGGGRKPWARV